VNDPDYIDRTTLHDVKVALLYIACATALYCTFIGATT
jgi:hypothetical protein